MKRNNGYSLLLIITLLGSLLFSCQIGKKTTNPADTTSDNQPADTTSESQPADGIILDSKAGQVYEVGDIISIGNTILVVLGWDVYPGGLVLPPSEGYKHLAVDVILANQGKDPFEFSPGHSTTLNDPSGAVYYMNGISSRVSGSDSPEGEMIPGEIIRGKIGFEVPEDQVEFVFILEPDQYELGDISVNLGPTPVSLAPPSDLNLKLSQKAFLIGDSAEIMDIVIQVIGVSYLTDDEIIRPIEGYKSIVVDLQVKNQSDDTLYFTGPNQIYLKDSTGQKYSSDPLALLANTISNLANNLEPGESTQGLIGFTVPEDASGVVFVFDADMFEFGKVFISLD
ncbi:MAG: DUF4352 domain-containing protein [Anaerolineales bacterium]|nr:DUF4352 domain-containing protein [Anaerolineales bacterium]